MQRELDKVIGRIAWKIALADGRHEPDHALAAARMAYGYARYTRMAKVAYDEMIKVDQERQYGTLPTV